VFKQWFPTRGDRIPWGCATSFQGVREASVIMTEIDQFITLLWIFLFSFAMDYRKNTRFVQTYVSRY